MKQKTKQCCYMICGTFLLILALFLVSNHTLDLNFNTQEGFNNINELNEHNNNRQIHNTNIMNGNNEDNVKPYSVNILKQKMFRKIDSHQDESLNFFSNVSFAPGCASNYSDSRGQACITEEQSKHLVNRGNKHQSSV